jgi:HPt (histidine-containing phosphotransfer) domain-containing protein
MNDELAKCDTVLDFSALESRCLGNAALVERVLAKFVRQLDADMTTIMEAFQSGNCAEVAEVAHRIKGTAGSVEARDLYRHAARAEQLALEDSVVELPGYLSRLQNDRSELVATIAQRNRQMAVSAAQ